MWTQKTSGIVNGVRTEWWSAGQAGYIVTGKTEEEAIAKLGEAILENTFPIGYLVSIDDRQQFWCRKCTQPCAAGLGNHLEPPPDYIKVYRINIGIYSQVCDACGVLVVKGATKAEDGKPLCLFGRSAYEPPDKRGKVLQGRRAT